MELSIVMPCLNEAKTIVTCINKALSFLDKQGVEGEVVIADNGSTDGSQSLAEGAGARVVNVPQKGYGSALMGGIMAAKGQYIIMGDADDSYDFVNLMAYVEKLREGYDLVMGNRFKGGVKPGAMPFLHKYLGNPVLSFIGRLFFNIPVGDFHCGLRGFRKDAIERMQLRTTGMEFASEMVVKASLHKMKITEVPTTLSPDGRGRPPHLRTWRDGWRHLRFLLMYSPRWLFLLPGLVLILLGAGLSVALISGPLTIGSIELDVHTLIYASAMIVAGFQSIVFYTFSKMYAYSQGLYPEDEKVTSFIDLFNLEKGLIWALLFLVAGFTLAIHSIMLWNDAGFGNLDPTFMLRRVIPASTLLILGVQMLFYSFFFSILQIKQNKS
jgi:glycosyltransferase involved in cell wall biosynthesis